MAGIGPYVSEWRLIRNPNSASVLRSEIVWKRCLPQAVLSVLLVHRTLPDLACDFARKIGDYYRASLCRRANLGRTLMAEVLDGHRTLYGRGPP